ncbi:MAG: 50S ribosomal protein L9 [Coriobacteriaceae bacterium]|jgi:large subunit ribosomal protein L9|nr:50S ribosomal protein L9 [Coriobacteriaceae bacterium]
MKVILLQEVKGKGGEGDVVEVAKGFAVNYLYPQNMAIPATKGNLKQLEQRKHNIAKREENRLQAADKTKETLEGLVVKIDAKVGEEGQLFGSVTSQMIAEALQEATGIEVDKRHVDLKTPIKKSGEHEVIVSLYRDIKTTVKLFVGDLAKESAAAEEAAKAEAAEEAAKAEAAEAVEIVEAVEETDAIPAGEAADLTDEALSEIEAPADTEEA